MAEGAADGYLPGSFKEFVKYAVSGIGGLVLLKKFAPGIALKAGVSDGVWVKNADGSIIFQPTMPTPSK